jgi:hypothetical protein
MKGYMRDYTKIEAWKLADDLTVLIYPTVSIDATGMEGIGR